MKSIYLPFGFVAAVVFSPLIACAAVPVPGDLNTNFNPGTGADWRVLGIARQPDGRLVVGGQFNNFNGVPRNRVTRLNYDGSTDFSFNPGSGADSSVNTVAVTPDGKVVVGGDFLSFNGVTCQRLVRLNADGSLDTSFAPSTGVNGTVQTAVVQADGRVLIAGGFTAVNGTARTRLARLNTDGSVDTSFNPGTGPNANVLSLALQTDGKLLVGGYFSAVNGLTRHRVARLNGDGSVDTTFVPGTQDNGYVNTVSVGADGKILVCGGLYVGMNSRILRLNANGSVDTGFNVGNNVINSDVTTAYAQNDGRVVIGGYFTSINGTPRNAVARLNINGTLDTSFDPGAGANDYIWTMIMEPDGSLVAGGSFTTYQGASRNRITRIHNSTLNQAPLMASIGSLTILEDGGPTNVTVTGIAPGPVSENSQTVTNVTATSSDPAIIPHPLVTYTPGAATATLEFAPAANANGSVTISVIVQDDGGTLGGGVDRATNTFTVTVTPVDDPPSFALPAGTSGSATTNRYLYTGALTNVTLPPGTYNITAYGAQGGGFNSPNGGLGAEMSAQFNFSEVTTLTILVGGAGGYGPWGAGSGGGGSFVQNKNSLLNYIIAGGGGGSGFGSVGEDGGAGPNGSHGGGENGQGGQGGTGYSGGGPFGGYYNGAGGGGGGLLGNGLDSNHAYGGAGGQSFANGGAGAPPAGSGMGPGGFGGGGAGGNGGGYSYLGFGGGGGGGG
ncbi:MAG: hypothetical protein WCS99_18580, partial [Limisphaerales bacterium]